jgi:transposase
MRSEGKTLKMKNQQLVSPSRQCSNTMVSFGQRFHSKDQVDNNGAPPYSPDLAPVDVYQLKSALKGWHFCDATDINNVMKELKRLSQNDFQEYFQHL